MRRGGARTEGSSPEQQTVVVPHASRVAALRHAAQVESAHAARHRAHVEGEDVIGQRPLQHEAVEESRRLALLAPRDGGASHPKHARRARLQK